MSSTLMALDVDLKELRERKPSTFKDWLNSNPADKDLVLEYVNDRSISAEQLSITLRRNGIPVTRNTIEAYRESSRS